MKTLNEKLIGILLTITLALTGTAYAGLNNRIGTLEQDRKDLTQVAKVIEVQTAVMNAQIQSMQDNTKSIIGHLEALDESQRQTSERVNALLLQFSRNSKAYEAAMKIWSDSITHGPKR